MMVDDYGELWVRRHGEKPSMAWCRTIDSLTNEQLKQGLRKLEDSKEFIEYPPNRKQFKDLCLAASHEIPTVKALGLERRELTDDEHQLALDNLKKMKGELMK